MKFLPREKVEQEIAYLAVAVEKTAGPAEQEAWDWLIEKIGAHYGSHDAQGDAAAPHAT